MLSKHINVAKPNKPVLNKEGKPLYIWKYQIVGLGHGWEPTGFWDYELMPYKKYSQYLKEMEEEFQQYVKDGLYQDTLRDKVEYYRELGYAYPNDFEYPMNGYSEVLVHALSCEMVCPLTTDMLPLLRKIFPDKFFRPIDSKFLTG